MSTLITWKVQRSNFIIQTKKLIRDLSNKGKRYIHYTHTTFVFSQGTEITEVHRIVSYRQKEWLEAYIVEGIKKEKHHQAISQEKFKNY